MWGVVNRKRLKECPCGRVTRPAPNTEHRGRVGRGKGKGEESQGISAPAHKSTETLKQFCSNAFSRARVRAPPLLEQILKPAP